MSSMVKHNDGLYEFYNDKTILMTGSTGFLGMIVIEKLLRSFPGIKRIIIIIRNKRGKTSSERMQNYFEDEIFSRVKTECPSSLEKVLALNGDVSMENCGLQPDEIEMIQNEVDLVLHCAATISFTDTLKNTVKINVGGTSNMLKLSRGIKNLITFIFVSTMYSYSRVREIEEKIYPHPILPEKLMDLVDSLDDETLEKITPILLGDWPNAYTYSKNAAENLVYSYRNEMPVVIFRPSIITAPYQEPMPAWINKFMGPYGWMAVTGLGFSRIIYVSAPDSNSNIVPCDFVAHALIAVIWDSSIQRRKTGATIVNYTSAKNPMTWKYFRNKLMVNLKNAPFSNCIWHPMAIIESSYPRFLIYNFFLQRLPAYTIDFMAVMLGKKPSFVKLDDKVRGTLEQLYPFLEEFKFQTDHINTILDRMTEKEKNELVFDMSLVKWDEYCKNGPFAVKKYLLKDPMTKEAIQSANTKFFWLLILDKVFKLGLTSVLIFMIRYIYRRRFLRRVK